MHFEPVRTITKLVRLHNYSAINVERRHNAFLEFITHITVQPYE